MGVQELTTALRMSIAPVALISGVGLILLSMTNRLARTIDRARDLSEELRRTDGERQRPFRVQIRILYKRYEMLRLSITLASVSILFASVIVLCLFAMYSFHARFHGLVVAMWALGAASLVASLILFIHDVTLSLRALKLNVGEYLELPKSGGDGSDSEPE